MEFYDVVKARRSIRGYKSDPIPEDALKRIAEAVSLAPSACNIQPWSFRLVLNAELRKKICAVYASPWLAEAPAIAVALGNAETCWKRLEGAPVIPIDIGIVMEHLVLAAAAEGLGTCWICAYDVEKMNKALNILPPWSAYAISPLGYANVPPNNIQRKPVDEIFKIIK
jgi:nitroreductase